MALLITKDLICEAILSKRLLRFSYQNHTRVVEPHILGRDTAGNEILSAYLVGGYSESRKEPYWRSYLLSDLTLLEMLDETFPGPRKGYNPNDPKMVKAYCRLARK
jgi:hypothetical protein